MGRKRKIPTGYIPKWESESEHSDVDILNNRKRIYLQPIHGSSDQHGTLVFYSRREEDPQEEEEGEEENGQEEEEEEKVEDEEEVLRQNGEDTLLEENEMSEDSVANAESNNEPIQNYPPFLEEGYDEDDDYEDIWFNDFYEEDADQQWPIDEEPAADNDPVIDPQLERNGESEDNDEQEDEEEEEEVEEDADVDDEQVDKDSFKYILSKFSEEWIMNENDHQVSKAGSSGFWNVATKWMTKLSSAFEREKKKKFPKFAHIRKKLVKNYVPPIALKTGYVNKETNELTITTDMEKTPVKDFPADRYEKVFEIANVKV